MSPDLYVTNTSGGMTWAAGSDNESMSALPGAQVPRIIRNDRLT
jgi:hypothetical protein